MYECVCNTYPPPPDVGFRPNLPTWIHTQMALLPTWFLCFSWLFPHPNEGISDSAGRKILLHLSAWRADIIGRQFRTLRVARFALIWALSEMLSVEWLSLDITLDPQGVWHIFGHCTRKWGVLPPDLLITVMNIWFFLEVRFHDERKIFIFNGCHMGLCFNGPVPVSNGVER